MNRSQRSGLALSTSLLIATAAVSAENELEEVIVTGSLIQRPNNTAVSPIVSISDEVIKESGVANMVDVLNKLPSFTVGGNSATGGQGTGGRATINLHGLGTNRNLVLLDGRRLPVSDVNGNVDVNIIPESIIGSVDAITGGASAVYGSDAMSGVVNFKTLRSLDGVLADVQYSMSGHGDTGRLNASLAFGTSYAESRGSLIAVLSYTDQNPLNGSRRDFFFDKTPSSFIGTGTFVPSSQNAPSAAVLQALYTGYGISGTRNPLLNQGFNNDGTLFVQTGAVNYRGPANDNGYMVVSGNVRMPVGQQIDYINGLQREGAFLKTDYAFTDSLTAYGQFMYSHPNVSTASGGSLTQFPALTTIPVTNPFIPADLQTVLASRPQPAANFGWNARYVGVPYKNWEESYQVQQYLVGLKGDIADGWTFDAYASYDQSVHDQTMHQAVLKSQVQRLLNAPDGGASLCAGGFNPFGDTNARSLSQQCVDFITKDALSREDLDQTMVQGQINGTLFDLGAGSAQVAFLADWRENRYQFSPDRDFVSPGAFNIYVPSSPGGNIEAVVNTLPVPRKSISVTEVAAQIDVPLLAGRHLVEELAVGGAVRYSDYSTTGGVTSFELDARWRPMKSLLMRGGYQHAVRAPNIGELFSPPQGQQLVIGTPPASLGDPCDVRSSARTGANGTQVAALCVQQGIPLAAISSYTFPTTATGAVFSGNLDLTPEKADTYNIGVVWSGTESDGLFGKFTTSIDYFNINIDNVISTIPGLTVLSQCYNLDGSNPSYDPDNGSCQLVSRDSSGQLLNVATPYKNLGSLKTDGVELQVNWGLPFFADRIHGGLYVDTAITWLNSYRVQNLPGGPFVDYTGISVGGANPGAVPPRAAPEFAALTTFGYRGDTLGGGLRWRYQSSLEDVSKVLTPNNVQPGVPSYQLWDLFASWKFGQRFELRGGVNNLFDQDLPLVYSSQNLTDTALYDVIGRAFYVGVKASF
jgi:outer membrane receptor protein involved in Fe transport